MTKEAEEIFEKVQLLERKLLNSFDDDLPDIEAEIESLESEICPSCNGEGEVIKSFSKNNPNIIDIPYMLCPNCKGTGVR